MIALMTCECNSAMPLARQTCQKAGIHDWMAVPLHKGKEHCLTVLSHFPSEFKELLAFRALEGFISNHGTFVCVVGYDKENFYWADVSNNDPKSVFDAIAILKRFA